MLANRDIFDDNWLSYINSDKNSLLVMRKSGCRTLWTCSETWPEQPLEYDIYYTELTFMQYTLYKYIFYVLSSDSIL